MQWFMGPANAGANCGLADDAQTSIKMIQDRAHDLTETGAQL
jgi:hypothetical protein